MSAAQTVHTGKAPYYYVPPHSPHPIRGSLCMLATLVGAALWVNDYALGPWLCGAGILGMFFVLFCWFGDAIRESEGGLNSQRIDHSYRWSMTWFIFSEVMFFGAFFGALWYTRTVSTPWLSTLDSQTLLWPGFSGTWPNFGPAGTIAPFETVGPFWLPTINTALLLSSALTVTVAHHALRANHRARAILWLAITIILGFTFVGFQAYEYHHAYTELNLRFSSGAFGALFYMLTGFHGFHVILGGTMLTVIWLRLVRGHFTAEHHFGFEGVAWYWHFVDVVWLGLYIFVYWM
ncbi:cytochrome c oxidase subunit 3 [Castellaniella sp. MT123]|uniref:cytochrome c oxidase subunit 3 n=1 Tax=Castellaniella sp. MT123 TaxID=3140381 RepID=UPI0031F42C34|nr:cytochrome c oxidase subunit 3 [Castellaniella sp.]